MVSPPLVGAPPSPSPPPSAVEIRDWLVSKIAEAQQIESSEVNVDEELIHMGLDSIKLVVIVGEMEQWLGCQFKSNPLVDYPTINVLSAFLADRMADGETLIDPSGPAASV
jgi:acyl carrier protein